MKYLPINRRLNIINGSFQSPIVMVFCLIIYLTVLLPAITALVNCALLHGMPSACKSSIIRPLLKKKGTDHESLGNYRPVSILPFMAKIIERVVMCRLTDHLEENSLLDIFQSAYRPSYSCETALIYIMNLLHQTLDQKKVAVLALFDLSAAFDTVDHAYLQNSLESVGIVDQALNWLIDYLDGRHQSVIIHDSSSSPSLIKCGVPQGSVLGPILFSIYMNGIKEIFDSHDLPYVLYADDVQVVAVGEPNDVQLTLEKIQTCARHLGKWLSVRQLKMNEGKTEILVVGSQRILRGISIPSSVDICGSEVSISQSVRDLGIIIDRSLTFHQHINKMTAAAFSYIHIIGRWRQSLPLSVRILLIHALVLSRINYCSSLLQGVASTSLKRLQHIINTSIRMASGKKREESIQPELKKLGWLPIQQHILWRFCCLIYKVKCSQRPLYLSRTLHPRVPSRDLRSADECLLVVPNVRTRMGEMAFMRMAPSVWNRIPKEIRLAKSFSTFKNNLHKHLMEVTDS
jgi:hypothetical protein